MQKTCQLLRLRGQEKLLSQLVACLAYPVTRPKKYLLRFQELGLDFETVLSLSDLDLPSLLQDQPPIALANKVSIENVAKMLGHTDVKMTKHYACVLDQSILKDMEKINSLF